MALLGQGKNARRVSAVISIFDDSSREGSENSQDDEQFRARKEFLKSGLPDSFRKQIAKTTATKEAYSLSCSSFQPVIHTKQQSNGMLLLQKILMFSIWIGLGANQVFCFFKLSRTGGTRGSR